MTKGSPRDATVHIIRLRAAWSCLAVASKKIPSPLAWREWGGEALGCEIECTRIFHRPTGIEPTQRVELVIPWIPEIRHVRLNGEEFPLISDALSIRHDITTRLLETNELVVTLALPNSVRSGNAGPIDRVPEHNALEHNPQCSSHQEFRHVEEVVRLEIFAR